MICEVIVDVESKQVNRAFDYLVPEQFASVLEVGYRVMVPFGPRIVMGFVVKTKEDTTYEVGRLREIKEIVDLFKPLNEEFIELAQHMAEHNFSFYATCLQTMIPSALKMKYKKVLYCEELELLSEGLQKEFRNSHYVSYGKAIIPYMREITQKVKSGVISVQTEVSSKARNKMNKLLRLKNETIIPTSKKGKDLMKYLLELDRPIQKEVVVKDMGFSPVVISTLVKNGIVEEFEEEVYRQIRIPKQDNKKVVLNEEQIQVIQSIEARKKQAHTFVLKGITGSGKTEVYMELIENVLKEGKEAILLVPEIALTPQMNARFHARFGSNIAVMHSGLKPLEKYDEWRKVLNQDAKIVVGARSAIFAPFTNLGIIIIDEAQEDSYIQDNNPRYDACEIAKIRSRTHQCPLVLGSATPKVSEYYKGLQGESTILHMKNRANHLLLPKSEIVSMVDELKKGNRSVFSMRLQEEMRNNLKENNQSILFLNRRGFSSFVMCRSCGETVKCPHCDISLTYHKMGNVLKCHHCGYSTPMVRSCPSCNSILIKEVGTGTQKIELEVNRLFPQARVIRMDNDTMKKAVDYEDAFLKFKNKEADILIGTQMIAKGLDFEDVTLVGVLNADLALKYPGYDSNEVCYSLIEQVSGRAGRGTKSGKVIIQSYNPEHYAITCAAKHDYEVFYNSEIENRWITKNPPFCSLVEIRISSKNPADSYKHANIIKRYLERECINSQLFGPAEATIFKENDYFTYVISLKIEDAGVEKALAFINNEYQDNRLCNVTIRRM